MERKNIFYAVLFASIATNIYFIYPSIYQCETIKLPSRPLLDGSLAINDHLTKAELILKDQIFGPESLVVEGDTIYTGTQKGTVVEIKNGKIHKEIRFGPVAEHQCDGSFDSEPLCGRPLGLRRLSNETLVVVDPYFGIFTVNFAKGTHAKVLDKDVSVEGAPLMFLNDIDVISEDQIIFTHSSARWNRRHFMNPLLEGIADGRVLSLELSSGKLTVLLDKLYYANGIQLFPDKQSFLVAETALARIKRHWLLGSKKGQTEIFAENLPGLPDNIRAGTGHTFWVALASVRHRAQFSLIDFLSAKPLLRKLVLQIVPDRLWRKIPAALPVQHAMILQLNADGQIVRSAHDPDGRLIQHVSQAIETDQFIYLGSFHANFIARLRKQSMVMSR